MELQQLEMFVAVYQERSFKRGAKRVCRTQPAVSLAIAKLEREIGSPVLERKRGRREELHLTRTGELIYQYASQMLGLRDELLAVLVPGRRHASQCLRLGISEDYLTDSFGELVGSFRRRRPYVRVEVCYEKADTLFAEVRERKLDLAILDALPRFLHGNMETICVPTRFGSNILGQEQTLWVLRNRAGRSRASWEFEQELCSLTAGSNERAAV